MTDYAAIEDQAYAAGFVFAAAALMDRYQPELGHKLGGRAGLAWHLKQVHGHLMDLGVHSDDALRVILAITSPVDTAGATAPAPPAGMTRQARLSLVGA